MYKHLFDLLQFSDCLLMILYLLLLADQKVLTIDNNIEIFMFSDGKKKIVFSALTVLFSNDKQKVYLHPENVDKYGNLNMGFVSVLLLLIVIYLS